MPRGSPTNRPFPGKTVGTSEYEIRHVVAAAPLSVRKACRRPFAVVVY